MNFDKIVCLTEELQKELIGDPNWIASKQVFEYQIVDVKTVCILKAVRAVQGLKSLEILCNQGLFIDMCALWRCIYDCIAEIYFVLEEYPSPSLSVEKFVADFANSTIDGHLDNEGGVVLSKKIHAAMARVLNKNNPHSTSEIIKKIYKTFSGYTHANYSHIMQSYGGSENDLSFNLSGVPSFEQKQQQMQLVNEIVKTTLGALHFIAFTFAHVGLQKEIASAYKEF